MRKVLSVVLVAGVVVSLAPPARAQARSMEYMAGFAALAQQICKFNYSGQAQRDIESVRKGAAGNSWRMTQLAEGEAAAQALGRDCKALGSAVAEFSW